MYVIGCIVLQLETRKYDVILDGINGYFKCINIIFPSLKIFTEIRLRSLYWRVQFVYDAVRKFWDEDIFSYEIFFSYAIPKNVTQYFPVIRFTSTDKEFGFSKFYLWKLLP